MVPAEIVSAAEDCAGDDVFFQRIREWLDSGGDVNDTYDEWDNEDLSLLGRCAHPHLTKFLLERGADVDHVDYNGWTPLYYACGIHSPSGSEIVNVLLDAGANIDAKTTEAVQDLAIAGETALSTSLDWFRHTDAKTALRYVTLLLRRGTSLDDCWGGMSAEACLRHIEHPETFNESINNIYDQMDPSMATNEDFIACKKLIADERRRRFVAKRKEVLRLRSLVVRGRAKKSSDAMIEPSFRLPDGVLWNVLSFWPPQRPKTFWRARVYDGPRPGCVFTTRGGRTGYWLEGEATVVSGGWPKHLQQREDDAWTCLDDAWNCFVNERLPEMKISQLMKMLATLKPLAKDAYKAAMAAREGKNEEAARQVVRALFEHITRGAILDAYAKAYAPPGPLTGALALDYRGPGYLPENRPRP